MRGDEPFDAGVQDWSVADLIAEKPADGNVAREEDCMSEPVVPNDPDKRYRRRLAEEFDGKSDIEIVETFAKTNEQHLRVASAVLSVRQTSAARAQADAARAQAEASSRQADAASLQVKAATRQVKLGWAAILVGVAAAAGTIWGAWHARIESIEAQAANTAVQAARQEVRSLYLEFICESLRLAATQDGIVASGDSAGQKAHALRRLDSVPMSSDERESFVERCEAGR